MLEKLADADAFRSLGLDRREALWAVRGLDRVGDQDDLPLFAASRPERDAEPDAKLPPMPLGAHVVEDYRRLSLSLKAHPTSFMRARLSARGILRSDALASVKSGERVTVAGLVLVRQRPGTAKGVIFMTLEDETGVANVIVWPKAFERLRAIVLGARFVAVTGKLQNEQGVIHVIADRMEDLTPMLGLLSEAGETIATHRPRRRGQAAAGDDGAEAPGQPLRPDAAARRSAAAAELCRSKRSRRSARCRAGGISVDRPIGARRRLTELPTSENRIVHAMMAPERAAQEKAMQTELATLKELIIETARKSPVGEKVEGVDLEFDRDDDGVDFLRVMIHLKSFDEADYPALANLIEAIEDAVGEIDERYPSVRFPDAA